MRRDLAVERQQRGFIDERLADERLTACDDEQQKSRRTLRPLLLRLRMVPALTVVAAISLLLIIARAGMQTPPTSTNAAPELVVTEYVTVNTPPAPPSRLQQAQSAGVVPAAAGAVAAATLAPGHKPPYSVSADCRRQYDRSDRGDGFARCGSSCCRSHAGIACYYQVSDPGLCDRFLAGEEGGEGGNSSARVQPAAAGGVASGRGSDGGGAVGGGSDDPFRASIGIGSAAKDGDSDDDDDDDDDDKASPPPLAVATSSAAGGGSSAASGVAPEAVAAAASAAAAAAAAVTNQRALQALVPMLLPQPAGSQRRPRMLRYPSFNLTWTRGAPPPRADAWSPSEKQRLRLPARDLKELYFSSARLNTELLHRAAPHTCSTQLLHTAAPHSCSTQLLHTAAPHSCSTQLLHGAAPRSCCSCRCMRCEPTAFDTPCSLATRAGRSACGRVVTRVRLRAWCRLRDRGFERRVAPLTLRAVHRRA